MYRIEDDFRQIEVTRAKLSNSTFETMNENYEKLSFSCLKSRVDSRNARFQKLADRRASR